MIDKDHFRRIIEAYLLPMFSGTSIASDPEPSTRVQGIVSTKNTLNLWIKPERESNYRYLLTRSQVIEPTEKRLVKTFIEALGAATSLADDTYFEEVLESLPRRVIADFVSYFAPRSRRTLLSVLDRFTNLSSQTYEGDRISYSLGITGSLNYGNEHFEKLIKEDFSVVLTNGYDTLLTCGSDGLVFKYNSLPSIPSSSYPSFAPFRTGLIAHWADKRKVAVTLNRAGELLIFNGHRLLFSKRRGRWSFYPHEATVKRMWIGSPTLRTAIYETCLDVSFARTGGCIAVVKEKETDRVKRFVPEADLLEYGGNLKSSFMKSVVKSKFHEMDRRLRQELVAVDGATVLDHKGNVLAVGAIVGLRGGSAHGGRYAAAKHLSKIGLGLKVSSDGGITGFHNGDESFVV